ncbi:MAG: hypothetical protein ACO25F_02700 [Erythrobacter sp.]
MTCALILGLVALAGLATAWGGRAQSLVAGLSAGLGAPQMVWLVALLCGAPTALVMGLAGAALAAGHGPSHRGLLIAAALLAAAFDLMLTVRRSAPQEPTRSLGAIALVLSARQMVDAPRWLAFASGAAMDDGLLPALAVTTGSGAALALAAFAPGLVADHGRAMLARRILALALLAASVWAGFHSLPASPQ